MNLIHQINQLLKSTFQWWVLVSPWEQAVRVYLGKHAVLLGPGFHWRFPFVHQVFIQPIRVRAQHINPQTMSDRTGGVFSLASAIRYEVTDLLKLYKTLHNAHETIEQEVQGVLAEIIYTGTGCTPDIIRTKTLAKLDLSKYGLRVYDFNVTSFAKVRTYRLISGEMGTYSDYNSRLETSRQYGEPVNP